MDAQIVYKEKITLTTATGCVVTIFMDLYRLSSPFDPTYPEGYKFSWIAFDTFNSDDRVLFDCHIPKGPHLHVNQDKEGKNFKWVSLNEAENLFFSMIQEKFGEIPELREKLL